MTHTYNWLDWIDGRVPPQPDPISQPTAEKRADSRLDFQAYNIWRLHNLPITTYPPMWARGALRCGSFHWRTV